EPIRRQSAPSAVSAAARLSPRATVTSSTSRATRAIRLAKALCAARERRAFRWGTIYGACRRGATPRLRARRGGGKIGIGRQNGTPGEARKPAARTSKKSQVVRGENDRRQ